jgi:hypothetical protein
VVPERGSCKGRVWIDGVTDETSRGVGVHSEEERNKEVMCVPESLKGLLTNLCMGGRIHQEHAEEHDMACYTTNFRVVDLNGCDLSDLSPLNIEEAEAVSMILRKSTR